MSKIEILINADDYKINYDSNNLIYTIEFNIPNPILIKSILKPILIQGATTDENFKKIKFKAHSVKTLHQYLNENNNQLVNTSILLINSLSKQIQYLIKEENYTFLGYSLDNIFVINEQKFIFLGIEYLKEINENEEILISNPYSKNDFYIAPELKNLISIPNYIHYKSGYFSLGCLVIRILLGNNEFYDEYLINDNSVIESLKTHLLKNTKIYWFLSRCLNKESKQRCILFI